MKEEVRKDIILVLKQVIEILKEKEEKDVLELKELSNHTIHCASIYQDEDSISVAVFVYALYKLFDRHVEFDGKVYSLVYNTLIKAKNHLSSDKIDDYRVLVKQLFSVISKADERLKMYIEEVLEKARITKGSKLVEHGISVAKAAELMGISQWELMSYLGKTSIIDRENPEIELKKKLNYARKLFQK